MIIEDTIAAVSTPAGTGSIAVVRLSGPRAWAILEKIFRRGKNPNSSTSWAVKSHEAVHGFIFTPPTQDLLDEVIVIPYKAPNSYTGEDMVEINCHGSPVVTAELVALLLQEGARLARNGEFTQRAYLNGRMDLTQAEAVLDVIQSKTGRQTRQALSALTGHVGNRIKAVRDRLIELLGRVVAGIDFPEEVGEISLDDVEEVVSSSREMLTTLARTVRSGRFLRDGMRLAIAGKPNAGKSSLLNQLLQFDRAIVTDIPGTTRDSLEELLDINGIPVILVDTAGVRTTTDEVEQIGIERTFKAIAQADLVLMVCDLSTGWTMDDNLMATMLKEKEHVLLMNKCDLYDNYDPAVGPKQMIMAESNGACIACLPISAKVGTGMEELNQVIESWVFRDEQAAERGSSLNARQGELCLKAIEALNLVTNTGEGGMPQDCLATDLKGAVDCLSEICGEAVSEEIIANVFATFCIGK
jgi:tRNA modification GTPase